MSDRIEKPIEFDRSATWEMVKDRRSACLDSNIWINLADEKTETATRVKELLIDAVAVGRVFCPLYTPVIWELYKQSRQSRLNTGALMEQASLNVCLSPSSEVFRWEVHSFAHELLGEQLPPNWSSKLYVPVSGYLGSCFCLEFSPDTPSSIVDSIASMVSDRMNSMSLTALLTMRDERISEHMKQMEAPQYSERIKQIRSVTKGDKEKAFRLEAESVFERVIHPAIWSLPPRLLLPFMASIKTLPRDDYGGILRTILGRLPAIHNHIETMAIVSQEPNRSDRVSDFFDLDLIPVPLAYCDALVSEDKRIRDIITRRSSILGNGKCKYVGGLLDFEQWLRESSTQ